MDKKDAINEKEKSAQLRGREQNGRGWKRPNQAGGYRGRYAGWLK